MKITEVSKACKEIAEKAKENSRDYGRAAAAAIEAEVCRLLVDFAARRSEGFTEACFDVKDFPSAKVTINTTFYHEGGFMTFAGVKLDVDFVPLSPWNPKDAWLGLEDTLMDDGFDVEETKEGCIIRVSKEAMGLPD